MAMISETNKEIAMENFFMYLLILVYVCMSLFVAGFQIRKSESPFINADSGFWAVAIIVILLSPITAPLILGYGFHSNE